MSVRPAVGGSDDTGAGAAAVGDGAVDGVADRVVGVSTEVGSDVVVVEAGPSLVRRSDSRPERSIATAARGRLPPTGG